jgi:hypothetical protein
MAMWVAEQEEYLRELIRHEGRGDAMGQVHCATCTTGEARYRCRDCLGQDMYCQDCVVLRHRENPCHRLQVSWIISALSVPFPSQS